MKQIFSSDRWTYGHRPQKNDAFSTLRSFALILSLAIIVAAATRILAGNRFEGFLFIAFVYSIWDSAITTFLIVLTVIGMARRSDPRESFSDSDSPTVNRSPTLSVLVAAYNEAQGIAATLRSIVAQTTPAEEIIIANDGSTDGTDKIVIEEFRLESVPGSAHYQTPADHHPRIVLLNSGHRGKGWALNAALAAACDDVVVTLDADTQLEPEALEEICRPFRDGKTAAVGGFIFIRNARGGAWITKRQYVEYLKNFLCRIGLAQAGLCLQVSGAFGAFRREILAKVGGFSTESLVEDYEIIYRLHRELRARNQDYQIVTAPQAVAFTDGPETVIGFIKQRTRWFAGFLQTLWEYRSMICNPRYGRIGMIMLPIKSVDALLPLWGLGSLALLLIGCLSGNIHWSHLSLLIFGVKWAYDIFLSLILLSNLPPLFPGRRLELGLPRIVYTILTDGLWFHWFRQAAVINAYRWFVQRIRAWEQPLEPPPTSPPPAPPLSESANLG